jgi:hypothetical protein
LGGRGPSPLLVNQVMSWLVNSGRYKLTRGARLTPLSLPRPSHSAAAAGAAMSTCNSAKGATAAAGLPGLPARRLLEAGVALVKGFDPLIQTVDAYAEEALRKKFQAGSGLSQDDAVFLREVSTTNGKQGQPLSALPFSVPHQVPSP